MGLQYVKHMSNVSLISDIESSCVTNNIPVTKSKLESVFGSDFYFSFIQLTLKWLFKSSQEGSRNYNKYIIIALQRHFKWPIIIMQSHKDSCKTSNFYILYISFINPVESVSKTVHHLLAQTPLRIHLIHYRVTSGSLCEHFPTWNVIRLQLECLQHVYSLFRVLKLF